MHILVFLVLFGILAYLAIALAGFALLCVLALIQGVWVCIRTLFGFPLPLNPADTRRESLKLERLRQKAIAEQKAAEQAAWATKITKWESSND